MISNTTVEAFLACGRIAVVGASDEKGNFGGTIYRELRSHGYDVVPVHPTAATVAGDACFADLDHVDPRPDGAMLVVNPTAAVETMRRCADLGIRHVWLFKGLGGPGALSDEGLQVAEQHGLTVVAGACPLMFLEPVGWFHRVHRAARRANRSLEPAN